MSDDCDFVLLKRILDFRKKYEMLKQSMDDLTRPFVETILKRVTSLSSRPLSQFNKYEILELEESLKKAAQDTNHTKKHYRVAYKTLRDNIDKPDDMFRDLVLPLLGDKLRQYTVK